MSCRTVRDMLHREPERLGDADSLVLEEHLQGCARCRADRARLALVRRLGAMVPQRSIGPRGHGRALAKALIEGPRLTPRRSPWFAYAVLVGAGLAGAAAIVVALRSAEAPSGNAAVTPTPPASPAARQAPPDAALAGATPPAPTAAAIVEGFLATPDGVLAPGDTVPDGIVLRAVRSTRMALHGATVKIAASSELHIASIERAVWLARGAVEVDGTRVVVDAGQFSAEIDGMARVTERGVAAIRGTVMVKRAGASSQHVVAPGTWDVRDGRAVPKPTVEQQLARARAAFAARAYELAEQHAQAALAASAARPAAAEARTILAECAHAAGRLDVAIARYESIAAGFAELPAAETALMAAARLEAGRGRREAARALVQRYLDRYPNGRFADDARHQLRGP